MVNPTAVGGPGTVDGRYSWTGNLPSGKSGKHIIYSVWSRSDSQETFYGCSDVTFDGGHGEVTGVGDTTLPPPSSDPSTPPRRYCTTICASLTMVPIDIRCRRACSRSVST